MRQIFFLKNKAVTREMSVPSTLWVAYWEWDGTFGFSGDTFNVEVEQHGQSHIWNIQLPVLRKQIHSASLIFSLCHGSDPQWQSLHSSQKRFPRPQQLLTASQHQSLSQLHSSSHGMTCHTKLAHFVVADCWCHKAAFWAWRAVLK